MIRALAAYQWPTHSGHSMVDGPTEIEDLDKTDPNKAMIQGFINDILIGGQTNKITDVQSKQEQS